MKLYLISISLIIFSLSSAVIAEDDIIIIDDVYSKLEANLDLAEEQVGNLNLFTLTIGRSCRIY
jgi:hypothetical protein